MKLLLVLVAVIGMTVALPPRRDVPVLKSLLQDFLDILAPVPLDKVVEITDQYLAKDAEFCEVITYLQGPEWAALVAEVGSKQEVQDFEDFLTDAGIPVDILLVLIHETIASLSCGGNAPAHDLKSLRDYLDAVEAVLPLEEMKGILEDKMANSADFQTFYTRISSENAHALVEEVRALDEVQRLAQRLKDMGVKVDEVFAAVYAWLGWGAPKTPVLKSLISDFMDILAPVPLDKVIAITEDYLAKDAEFCEVITYLQGPEWAALVEEVGSKQEVQDFEDFLTEAGIPVDVLLVLIHETIASLSCGGNAPAHDLKSLRDYLDAVEAVLPLEEMKGILEDKMANSPDFQAFYTRISSENAHALVEEVRALDEVQRLAQRLKDMGVKVDEVFATVYAWLGWGAPKLA